MEGQAHLYCVYLCFLCYLRKLAFCNTGVGNPKVVGSKQSCIMKGKFQYLSFVFGGSFVAEIVEECTKLFIMYMVASNIG